MREDVQVSCEQSSFRFYAAVVAAGLAMLVGAAILILRWAGLSMTPGTTYGGAGALVVGTWTGYWVFWRLCVRLEATQTTLRWRSLLRRDEVPLDRLRRISPSPVTPWLGHNELIRFQAESQPSVFIQDFPDLKHFVRDLAALAPQVQVDHW